MVGANQCIEFLQLGVPQERYKGRSVEFGYPLAGVVYQFFGHVDGRNYFRARGGFNHWPENWKGHGYRLEAARRALTKQGSRG